MSTHKTPGNGNDKSTQTALEIIKNFPSDALPLIAGGKEIYVPNWPKRVFAQDKLTKHATEGGSIGLKLQSLMAFDIEDSALGDSIFEWLKKRFPDAPVRTRPGSPSRAMLLAVEGPVRSWSVSRPKDQIEGKSDYLLQALYKGQLHAAGTRDDCGGVALEWDRTPSMDILPKIDDTMLQSVLKEFLVWLDVAHDVTAAAGSGSKHRDVVGDDLDYTPTPMGEAQLTKALQVIKRDTPEFIDRQPRTEMMHAIAGCSGKAEWGKVRWLIWDSSGGAPDDPRKAEEQWDRLKALRYGAGHIYEHLERLDEHALVAEIKAAEAFGGDDDDDAEIAEYIAQAKAEKLQKRSPLDAAMAELRAAREEPGYDLHIAAIGEGGFQCLTSEIVEKHTILPPLVDSRYAKGSLHAIMSAPGLGKSTLIDLEAVAYMANRPELVGEKAFDYREGAFIIVSNEDGASVVRRRIKALCREFKIPKSVLDEGRVFVWNSDPVHLIGPIEKGVVGPMPEATEFIKRLTEVRRVMPISHIFIDTLASAQPGVEENSVEGQGPMLSLLNRIARAAFAAVTIITHKRKDAAGSDDGWGKHVPSMSDLRGSTSISGAIRHLMDIDRLSSKDAAAFGITDVEKARQIIRFMGAKVNSGTGIKLAAKRFYRYSSVNVEAFDAREPDELRTISVDYLQLTKQDDVDDHDEGAREAELDEAFDELVRAYRDIRREEKHMLRGDLRVGGGKMKDETSFAIVNASHGKKLNDPWGRKIIEELIEAKRLEPYLTTISRNKTWAVKPVGFVEIETDIFNGDDDDDDYI